MNPETRTAVPPRSSRRSRIPGFRFPAVLLLSGAGLLGLAAFHRLDGALAQQQARESGDTSSPTRAHEAPPPAGTATRLRIAIPRLGVNLAVFEGVSERALRRGPGHLPGTPCPGLSRSTGNCVLTGHRDSFFRPLSRARAGDLVVLRSRGVSKRYRLVRRLVVSPEETQVAAPAPDDRLTLLTCYPFRWVGPAPLRLAWQAEPEASKASLRSR